MVADLEVSTVISFVQEHLNLAIEHLSIMEAYKWEKKKIHNFEYAYADLD